MLNLMLLLSLSTHTLLVHVSG